VPRLTALAAIVVALTVGLAACGGGSKDNSSTSASNAPGTLTTGAPPQPAPSGGNSLPPVKPAQKLRTSATLDAASAQNRPLTKLRVTVTAVKSRVKPGFLQAGAVGSGHMATVTIAFKNVGFATWSGNPTADAALITTKDRQASPLTVGGGCVNGFATRVELLPGETQRGCLAFILNRGASPKLFQFSPNFPSTPPAEWQLRK
jgi:Domain of unknown function (DUF4352)